MERCVPIKPKGQSLIFILVYNEKNIERVRRDEELARLSADKEQAKNDLEESKRRIARLRGTVYEEDSKETEPKVEFANFWAEQEEKERKRQKVYSENRHDLEIMKERHGLGPLPWYMKTDKISIDETSNNMSSKYRAPQDDPMFLVEKLLSNRKTKNPESDRRRQSRKKKSTQIQASDEMKHRRHHVHKVHHYSQKQSSSTTRR